MKEATRKVIIKIKEIKEQKKLSCQDILEICENKNYSVSPSTVRRICAKGREDGPDFRKYSIDAVFRAVVGTESAAENSALVDTENSALKAFVDLKDATLEDLQRQLDAMKEENASLRRTIEELQIRLDTTTNIIRLAVETAKKN